jgi:hypothetical protein
MSVYAGPEVVLNGLIFDFDIKNTKSWKGAPTTNLAKNASNQIDWSVGNLTQAVTLSTVTANEVYRITSTSATGTSFRIYFANAVLVNGSTYTVSYKYRFISGGGATFRANDWCDTAITRVTTDLGAGVFYETSTGTRATYDVTFRFLDLEISNNTVVEIWDLQLELGSFATPYSSKQVRSNTESIYDLLGRNTLTASSLTYNSDNTFGFNGSSNYIIFPENTDFNTQTVSIEVWVKTNATTQNGFWFEKGTVNSQYALFQEGGSITWRLTTNVSSLTATTASYMNTSQYAQVVGTYTAGDRRIYVNGVQVASDALNYSIPTNASGCSIGAYGGFSGGKAYYYNGNIDVVKVYNRALSATEVLQNFNALRGRYGI